MADTDHNLEQEIEAGLIRAEQMLARRHRGIMLGIVGGLVVIFLYVASLGLAYQKGFQAHEALVLTTMPTSLPRIVEIIDDKGVQMRFVPAGEFTMGSRIGNDDGKPIHKIYVDAFYIDVYEVTNVLYKACVDDGICQPPQITNSSSRFSYYGNNQYDDYPVIYVDWEQGKIYCEWRGDSTKFGSARLPTEAEWEKAARGTDERIYPWGNEINKNLANYDGNDTAKVGSYNNASPYGIYDLTGNVWEWVADWYDNNYYSNSPTSNPKGTTSERQYHVLRGGSWNDNPFNLRTSTRYKLAPSDRNNNLGFRCVRAH